MSAEVQEPLSTLSKVDSAIDDAPASPTESKIRHRRTSSTVSGVFNINDLGMDGSSFLPLSLSIHTPTTDSSLDQSMSRLTD